jgi:hypothetical protein
MEQVTAQISAREYAFELARWYHELAKICVQAAEHHLSIGENSTQEEIDRAMALNDIIRVRIATLQSVERVFRTEFPRLYIEHQVERILSLDPGPETRESAA